MASDRPRGRRCAMGCETWPVRREFALCPTCGEPTRIGTGSTPPLPDAEATTHLRVAQFEAWCDENGRK